MFGGVAELARAVCAVLREERVNMGASQGGGALTETLESFRRTCDEDLEMPRG